MRKWLLLAAMLLALAAPAWALEKTYDGSVNPITDGWTVYEGSEPPTQPQGSVFNEGGGNYSWFMNDIDTAKTKLRIGTGVDVNPDTGAYVEARIKSTSWSKGGGSEYPLNLGLQIRYAYPGGSTYKTGHNMAIRPDVLRMVNDKSKPVTYSGSFNTYHTYRLVYKRLDLQTRGSRTDSWGVYLDGGATPVLHSYDNASSQDWGGPTWGAGNTGSAQDIYFDWIYYTDAGAYPPGMDGTVLFTGGDPDGAGAADGQSFTITWQTNVPTTGELHYSINGDNSFSGVAYDPQDPSLTTSHSVTVTGVNPGATYEYFAVSTNGSGKKAISLPATVAVPNPYYIASGPTAVVAGDGLSATITWTTNLPDASSEVHYGLDSTCSTVQAEPGGGGLTSHSVTVPTEANKYYYYFVKSTHATWPAAQSSVRNFSTYVYDETLDNPGFEDGSLAPWVKVNPFTGIMNDMQWAVPAHSGSKWAGSVASYGTMNHGHLYQKVKSTPGSFYEAKVWIWTRRQADPSHELDVACAIGIDPYGGTSAESPNVIWSGWHETANSQTDGDTGPGGPWTQIGAAVKAKGAEATVFLIQQHAWPITWNINGFDDASWAVAPPPPDNIAATRRLSDGYPAQLNGKVVTGAFMDPESLEQFFYIEEADRSAGIRVKWAGSVSAGQLLDVSGTVQTINGEKTIIADEVGPETPSTGDIPAPFAVNGKAVVQGWGHQALPTQGLRVKAWGRVIYVDSNVVYIDDGTNYVDGTTFFLGDPVGGIRVYYPSAEVPWGGYVQVTGIPSVVLYTDNSVNPPVSRTIPVIWATEISTISE